jgi:hypothetical protein
MQIKFITKQFQIKSMFLLILFLISPVMTKSLNQITTNTKWVYDVYHSNPFYSGNFIEKIEVLEIYEDTIDESLMEQLDPYSIITLFNYTYKNFHGQAAQICVITDSIFMQSLNSIKTPYPGAEVEEPSNPIVNVFGGYIIQTDSLRFQIINNSLQYVIPIRYDSVERIPLAERNYFSKRCENINIDIYNKVDNNDKTTAEFRGSISTDGNDGAIIDFSGIQSLWFSSDSDMQRCNAVHTGSDLVTKKQSLRHTERMSPGPWVSSGDNYAKFLLNGRAIGMIDINCSRIELMKSGNRNVKSPIIRFQK